MKSDQLAQKAEQMFVRNATGDEQVLVALGRALLALRETVKELPRQIIEELKKLEEDEDG